MPPNSDQSSLADLKVEFNVKVKRLHPAAKLPERGSDWSAGADLFCLEAFTLEPGERKAVPTGLSVEIPPGWYGRLAPRSGLAVRHGAGERVAQLIIERAAICDFVWEENLSETKRGDGGFGSTGK
jgi:dUTP pyrophosphatase